MTELHRLTARQMVDLLRRGEVTPLEAVDAATARIKAVDGAVNALPTVALERAREQARKFNLTQANSLLAGLPVAIKDLVDVQGVRTTYGSKVFADHVPSRSDITVETLERNGAIVLAKSNTPEFGAGGTTYNAVFGKTLNPWDATKTSGGSSGGSAAALATGQVWLATGSDLGGSARTPASFCSIVGYRPSPGRVARGPAPMPFNTIWVEGPMARNVDDVALMLDAMAGEHPDDPISLPAPAKSFTESAAARTKPARIAYSHDLGLATVSREVIEACDTAMQKLRGVGLKIEDAHPDLHDALAIFEVMRTFTWTTALTPIVTAHRDKLATDVVWNIEKGLKYTAGELSRAELARTKLYYRAVEFFRDYDVLICPTTVSPPFDASLRYVEQVEGKKFENYVDWLTLTFAITMTSCPVVALPCGFTKSGLPVGLQIVGKPKGDAALLAIALFLEDALGIASLVPIDPRDGK
jgi:amidase